jgi:hypothetical protein
VDTETSDRDGKRERKKDKDYHLVTEKIKEEMGSKNIERRSCTR